MDMNNNKTNIRFTFGIIVLNGEPFIKYNLRALYPFAHQIIVVEGANFNSTHCATKDGHSLDNTLKILKEFKEKEDHDNKLVLVTAEDDGHLNGFWPGEKDEQCQAFAKRATGNWLWQIDIDEFYLETDMKRIIRMLDEDPSIATISFPEIPFWGSFDYRCDGIFLRYRYSEVHRLFRWRPEYKYLTHRPVTVINEEGVDLREKNWMRAEDMRKQGVYLYHYYCIFQNQVSSKMIYYHNRVKGASNGKSIIIDSDKYLDRTFLKLKDPFHVHTVNAFPSWLERFKGNHPQQIKALKNDIEEGTVKISMRNMDDVDALVKSMRYRIGVKCYKIWGNYISQLNWISRDFIKGRIGVLKFVSSFFYVVIGKKQLF